MSNPTIDFWDEEMRNNPDDPYTLAVAAYYLYSDQQPERALTCLGHCLQLAPDYIKASILKGVVYLSMGCYELGWPLYELRNKFHKYGGTQWQGKPTNDRVMIWDNEGYGDCIMYMRYLPWVKERCPNMEFACKLPLEDLARASFPDIKIIPYYSEAKLHCPITSLGAVFNTSLTTIPTPIPYVRPMHPMPPLSQKIGLHWKTDHTVGERYFVKSVPDEIMAPLLQRKDTLSLHQEDLHSSSFSETAAIISNLELVITGDTVIAHLAGALGKPTWVMLSHDCDWRWLTKRLDSPWYPNVRLFRQKELNDWVSLVNEVQVALNDRN